MMRLQVRSLTKELCWFIDCSIVKGDMKKGFYHDLERLQEKMTIQDLVRLIPGGGHEDLTLFI